MIKRYIAIAAVSAVSAAAMYFLNKATKEKEKSTEAKEKTGLRNPVSVVTKEDFLQAGISVDPPEGASNIFWLTIDGQTPVYSLDYFIGQNEYNLRVKRCDKLEDISGMYYTWTEELTASDGGARAVIQTVDGEAGICLWYRDGYTVSLSVRGEVDSNCVESAFHLLNESLSFS